MKIQIISTSVETKPTAKGSYQQLEVVFKNLTFQGKVESKKLMSFGANAAAFKALSGASSGATFEVTTNKNAQGYIDWVEVTTASADSAAPAASKATTTTPRSTYETPEERAQRQVLIVKQSSLSAAVSTLSVGAKSVKPEDILALAQRYTDWVFGLDKADAGPTGFGDLPDFEIPSVE